MFELDLSAEQSAVVDLVGALATDLVEPSARRAQDERAVPREVWSRLVATGLLASVDEDQGGGGVPDPLTHALAVEGLAQGDGAIAAALVFSGNAALLLGACGTEDQRRTLLPPFVMDPGVRAGVALHEGFGRAPSELSTTIARTAGGGWKVEGRKVAVPFGRTANPLVVVGVDPSDRRLRAAVVSGTDDGVAIVSDAPHLGLEAANLSTMQFDVRVDEECLVGGADADPDALARVISRLRLSVAAIALGSAQRARLYASDYATSRIAFGQPISKFQGVSFMLADAQIHLDAARLGVWELLTTLERTPVPQLERAVSMAVNHAGDVASSVTRNALQVLGGHGFITDHPVERWYRTTAGLSAIDFDPSCSPLTLSFSS